MTRVADLKALRDAVLEGQAGSGHFHAAWPDFGSMAFRAFEGSLDDAFALHKAVLPDHRCRLDIGRRCRAWIITPDNRKFDEYGTNPARAWLLAILAALIAKEKRA